MRRHLTAPPDKPPGNAALAAALEQAARLFEQQGANPYRVRAYRNAAAALQDLPVTAAELYLEKGMEGLEQIRGIGPGIARGLASMITTGQLPVLDRLLGAAEATEPLARVPGLGQALSRRLHDELGVTTLEGAAHAIDDGRLEQLAGVGPKRLARIGAAIRAQLAEQPATHTKPPPVADLLDIDREYLDAAGRGELPTIAPRRFNRARRAWLPILHTTRGERHYTALFSNTAHAHRLGRTRDWVVIYEEGGPDEYQATVVTARVGPLAGRRVVRGREAECAEFYRGPSPGNGV